MKKQDVLESLSGASLFLVPTRDVVKELRNGLFNPKEIAELGNSDLTYPYLLRLAREGRLDLDTEIRLRVAHCVMTMLLPFGFRIARAWFFDQKMELYNQMPAIAIQKARSLSELKKVIDKAMNIFS